MINLQKNPEPFDGDVFDAKEWAEMRDGIYILQSDGSGYWATHQGYSRDHDAFKSKPDWATHVVWFNK